MTINFDKYNLEELESSLRGIDRERFPENYQKLLQVIEGKRKEAPKSVTVMPVPEGFKSTLQDRGAIQIEYKEDYRVDVAVFLAIWLAGWTVGGVVAMWRITESWFMTLWLIGWAFGEYTAGKYLLWILFGSVRITLDEDEMHIRKRFFKWEKADSILKKSIKRIYQLKDREENSDNQPGWGLKVLTLRAHYLLKEQEYEKSEWLGGVLGKWAGLAFEKAAKPTMN